MKASQPGANERVKNCALAGVKNGAKAFGRARILEVAKKEVSAATAEKIVKKVVPAFERCLNASKERGGFMKCGDQLIASAGSELASEAILVDARVSAYFPDAGDRTRIAAAGRDAFARCMRDNESKGRRDQHGTMRTDNCETFVKMETALTIATEVLRSTVEKNMTAAASAAIANAIKESGDDLKRCWNSSKPESENAICLRKTAKKVAASIAREKLGRELPKDVQERDPAFRERLLTGFETCLEEKLPANLFTASNADAAAASCAASVYKQAALQVAESKVRAALARVADQVPTGSAMNPLIDSFVNKAFAECLGDNPDSARLDSCSLKLQKNVASAIAQALLPFKVDEFIRAGGGLEAYGLDAEKRKAMLDAVVSENKKCLRTTVKSLKSEVSEKEINACFKHTIRDLSLRLGGLEFERMAKTNGINVASPSFEELKNGFARDFGACLDEKKGPEFALDDYLKNLELCQVKIAKSLTVKIAKGELAKTVRQIFTEASSTPDREQLEAKLIAGFDACMEKAGTSLERENCVTKLRGEAALALARIGVESRAQKDLGELPAEIKELGAELDHCIQGGGATDNCTRKYLKASTTTLGKKILHKTMNDQLGAGYENVRPNLKPVEEAFEGCVNGIEGAVDAKFLEAIDGCGRKMEEAALDVALNSLSDTPASPAAPVAGPSGEAGEKEVSDKELAEMMSRAMLCLNGQLSPDTESSLESIDPESMEAELLKLIGAYVSYDLKSAHGNFGTVLAKVADDLKAAGPESARRKLLEELVNGGMLDQLLRSMIRVELEKSLASLPAGKQPPAALKAALLEKAALEKALSPELLEKVRPLMSRGVLEPVLVNGLTLRSSLVLRSLRTVKAHSLGAVFASPALEPWKDDPALAQLRDALK